MKITKKIMPIALLLVIGVATLQAQRQHERPPMEPEKMARRQTEKMTEQLSLNDRQAEKVAAINLKYAQQHQAKMEKGRAEKEARRADHQQVQEAKMAELKQVLTAEQFAKLEKAQAERKDRLQDRRKEGPRGKGKEQNLSPEKRSGIQTTKMVDELGLNEEQAKELRQINLTYAQKREAMMQENQADREAKHVAMKKLKDEQKAAIEKILNPEQLKQFEEKFREREHRHRGDRRKGDGRM